MRWIEALRHRLDVVFESVRSRRDVPPGPGHMRLIYPDDSGKTVREWVKLTEPDLYPVDGAAHLRPYIERLIASEASFTSLMAFTLEDKRGFSLEKDEGQLTASFIFDRKEEAEREGRARVFFAARGIEPSQDYAMGNGWVHDASKVIEWPVEGDAATLTELCQVLLFDLYGVEPRKGLMITYEDHSRR